MNADLFSNSPASYNCSLRVKCSPLQRWRSLLMRMSLVANNTVVSRNPSGPEMTGRAVGHDPVPPMAARRCLVMAADAVILPVALQASFAVPARLEAVAQGPPRIVMVPGHSGIVTFYAVTLRVAGMACTFPIAQRYIRHCAVILEPVSVMRLRPREGCFFSGRTIPCSLGRA